MKSPGPLAGLRVIDLTQHIAGPYCTKLLALYGASVIKVERPPHGDPMRYVGPFASDLEGPSRSLPFQDLNVNKLGVTLNIASPEGREILIQLVRRADVVVESYRPGTLDRLGLGYESLQSARPDIVLTSITNFGQTGPYRDLPASEIVLYAMGHEMYGTGQADAPPLSSVPGLSLCFAGSSAAVATVAASLAQKRQGVGDWIDVSIMETFLSSIDRRADSLVAYAYTGEPMTREHQGRRLVIPPHYNACRDGLFHLSGMNVIAWDRLLPAVDEEWVKDPRFRPPITDADLIEEFMGHWTVWCLARTKLEIVTTFQANGISCAPLNSVADLLDDPQLEARNYFRELIHPDLGRLRVAGLPFNFSRSPGALDRAAPAIGGDNEVVYGELGHSITDLRRLHDLEII